MEAFEIVIVTLLVAGFVAGWIYTVFADLKRLRIRDEAERKHWETCEELLAQAMWISRTGK